MSQRLAILLLLAGGQRGACFSTRSAAAGPGLGVSFSPAGLLTPFHIGASDQLKEFGLVTPSLALSGSSGGALAAAVTALNIPSSTTLEACAMIARQCRNQGTFRTLRKALDQVLQEVLPADVSDQLNERIAPCSIAYAELAFLSRSSRSSNININSNSSDVDVEDSASSSLLVGRLVSQFASRQDVIEVLRASCTIPIYFSGYPAVKVRGGFGLDGFFGVERRRFGCPPTSAKNLELIVCPFRPQVVGLDPIATAPGRNSEEGRGRRGDEALRIDLITPQLLADANKEWGFSSSQLVALALGPPPPAASASFYSSSSSSKVDDETIKAVYQKLYDKGRECTQLWALAQGGANLQRARDALASSSSQTPTTLV